MPQHPRELQGHRCVSFILQQTGRVCEWDYTRGGERIVVEPAGHIAVNESEAYFAAGRAGLGIVLAPELYVRADLEAGTLVRILPDWSTDPHPLYVMYPQNRHLTVKVRVFADWVAGIVGDRHAGVTVERRATAELVGA